MEKKEAQIYLNPQENPSEKDDVKADEKKRLEGKAEGHLRVITDQEAEKTSEDAGKSIKGYRAERAGKFKEQWKEVEKSADWVFTELFRIVCSGVSDVKDLADLEKKLGEDGYKKWKEVIEPELQLLAKKVADMGADEHMPNYFAEWQPGRDKEEKEGILGIWKGRGMVKDMETDKDKVWQIWLKYLKEAGEPV